MKLVDTFGRKINYLRLSVTDRCDFRCLYCMGEDMEFLPKAEVLTLEELERLCGAFIGMGVRPEHVGLETTGAPAIRGSVTVSEQLGGESYLYCGLAGNHRVIIHAPGQTGARRGDEIAMRFPLELTYLFDAEGRALPRPTAAATMGLAS